MSADPYAPPKPATGTPRGRACWREGNLLVVANFGSLPPRCIKCNAAATMGKPQLYSWHHPAYFLFLLGYVVAYLVVAAFAFRRMTIAIALCDAHRRTHQILAAAALCSLLLAIVMLVMFAYEQGWFGAASLLALLVAVMCAVMRGSFLRVVHIGNGQARLKGCGPAFLDSLNGR